MKSIKFFLAITFCCALFGMHAYGQNKGTCAAPYATLTNYADYAAADAAYSNQAQTWSPEATTTVYTYATFNSGPSGSVGFDFSNNSQGTSNGCLGNRERSIKIFAVGSGCNWANPSLGTMRTGNNGSTWSNPEFSGLIPNTDYIAVTELKATASCTMSNQYLTYYQISQPITCSTCATASCPVTDTIATTVAAARANLTVAMSSFANSYSVTLMRGQSQTICVPVTVPTESTVLGFKQKLSNYSSSGISTNGTAITYQLRPASNCSASPIAPSRTNAQPVISGFNPEWDSLAPGNYVLCYTLAIEDTVTWDSVIVDRIGYYNVVPAVAALSNLTIGETTIAGFSSGTYVYNVTLPYGTTVVPAVTATTADTNATKVITPATSLPGSTTIVVTAPDGITTVTYIINFTVAVQTFNVSYGVVGANGTLTATVDGNDVTSPAAVQQGKSVVFTATPNANFMVKEWVLAGGVVSGNTSNNYTLSNVTADSTVTVEFTSSTGVAENNERLLSLYPNPANDRLTVKLNAPIHKISVVNLNGQVVLETWINRNEGVVNTLKLSNGLYFLRIETASGVMMEKIQISK